MKDEVFDIQFKHNGKDHTVKVKTDIPTGPVCFGCDYDMYIAGKHQFTINHCNNEDEVLCWEVKKRPKVGYDPEFAEAIGNAIDKYYARQEIVDQVCTAIKQKRVIRFYYTNKFKKAEDWRILDPYLLAKNQKGNTFVTGFFTPTQDQLKRGKKSEQKLYLINEIKEGSFKVLPQTFDKLKIDPAKVYNTPTIEVICRVSFQ